MDWDRAILEFVNRDLANPVLDPIMVLVSLLGYLAPFAVVGLVLWVRGRRFEAAAFWAALAVAGAVTEVLKDVVGRARPEDVRTVMLVGGAYGMPSGHALRASAAAAALWSYGGRLRLGLSVFAGLTLVSRVYVGAHFPSDVLAGAALGVLVGLLAAQALAAVRYEASLPAPQRWVDPARIVSWFRTMSGLDYVLNLRLLGGHVQGADAALARRAAWWALFKFFGPLVPVAAFAVVFPLLFPELVAATIPCVATYFFPFGLEVGVPVCVASGLAWWQVVLIVMYIDLWLSLFLILNLDYLYSVPWLGRRMARAQEKGMRFVAKRPWLLRVQFVGVALFVFLPIAGTGIIPAVLIGRFIGMRKMLVWAATMLGTVTRITMLGLASEGVLRLVA